MPDAIPTAPTTLIIGLGNPILGDDGVGWRVAEQVKAQLSTLPADRHALSVEVDCQAVGGLSLMERLVGYKQAILIDAVITHQHPRGTVLRFPLEQLPNRAFGHLCSAHDTTLQNALDIGRKMGADLPDRITVIGIEAQDVFDFSEDLSPEVAQAVPQAVEQVLLSIEEDEP